MKRSVNIVIEDGQGRILVLKRNSNDDSYPGFWDLPGGGVKNNESPHGAAKREVEEECGLKVEPEQDYFFTFYFPQDKETNYVFGASFSGGNIKISEEHEEFKWVSKYNWQKIECTPAVTEIIKEFFYKNK